jgi:hypothetical protein
MILKDYWGPETVLRSEHCFEESTDFKKLIGETQITQSSCNAEDDSAQPPLEDPPPILYLYMPTSKHCPLMLVPPNLGVLDQYPSGCFLCYGKGFLYVLHHSTTHFQVQMACLLLARIIVSHDAKLNTAVELLHVTDPRISTLLGRDFTPLLRGIDLIFVSLCHTLRI